MNPSNNTKSTHAQENESQQVSGRKLEFRFVEQGDKEERKSSRAGIAKAHHKKSRNGCLRCRARRVKCDEIHPVCGNCTRHQVECVYEQVIATSSQSQSAFSTSSSIEERRKDTNTSFHSTIAKFENIELNETSTRRLLELKLIHTYNTNTCHTIFFEGDPTASETCIYKVPDLAFTNNALLYAVLSFTASHLAQLDPRSTTEMTFTYHRYWSMALEEHKNDLANLGPHNFDAVCMTSMFVRLMALVMVRDRPLTPYTPPTDWFQTTRGAMQVFKASYLWFEGREQSVTCKLVRRMPFCFDEDAKFAVSNRQKFLHLLDPVEGDELQQMPIDDRIALEDTLSYIGGIWLFAKGDTSTEGEICRRLIMLPHLAPAHFVKLFTEGHPRALVILAHYFAMLSRFRERWWMGSTGKREVHAIDAVLSNSWRPLIRWPLDIVDSRISN